MLKHQIVVGTPISVIVAGVILLAASSAYAGDAEAGATRATGQFYAALNAMFTGDVKPMEAIWSHADDVVYLPPTGERLMGWSAVSASWEKQASLKLGGKVEPKDVHVLVLSPSIAVVTNMELGSNPNASGGTMQVNIRSTKIFRLEDGQWKVIYDHADPLPKLASDARTGG